MMYLEGLTYRPQYQKKERKKEKGEREGRKGEREI
jgi:hypothetical protein